MALSDAISRADKLKELRREIAFRRNVYAKKVREHTMAPHEADARIRVMEAIAADYSDEPRPPETALSRLRQAILDNCQGDDAWLGAILVGVIKDETGFDG